jgi:hypothetical protein
MPLPQQASLAKGDTPAMLCVLRDATLVCTVIYATVAVSGG